MHPGLLIPIGFIIFMIGMAMSGSEIVNQRPATKTPMLVIILSVLVMILGGILVKSSCDDEGRGQCGSLAPFPEAQVSAFSDSRMTLLMEDSWPRR